MFCRFGFKVLRFLRWLMSVLTKLLDLLDRLHDNILCSHSAEYIDFTKCPQKGDALINES